MYNVPQFEFVWYFLIIRFRLCIFGRNIISRSDAVYFSMHPIRKHVVSTCPVADVNFDHVVKVASAEIPHSKVINCREFPGGPVVRTPCSHCRGPRFNLWSGK